MDKVFDDEEGGEDDSAEIKHNRGVFLTGDTFFDDVQEWKMPIYRPYSIKII